MLRDKYNVLYFADNDPQKWGEYIDGIQVISPNQLSGCPCGIIITSTYALDICLQLKKESFSKVWIFNSLDSKFNKNPAIENIITDKYVIESLNIVADVNIQPGENFKKLFSVTEELTNDQICLVVVFNHRYDANIEKLNQIYAGRFKHIFYLVPFYDGDLPNVIPVYQSSDVFQGYFAEAFKDIYQEQFTHYIFVADDLILNPNLSSDNILEKLALDEGTGYIKGMRSLSDAKHWSHYQRSINAFRRNNYVNFESEIPSLEKALTLFQKRQLYVDWQSNLLPYPMMMGYSDLFIIPSKALKRFARLCGVFAAMGLFVEVAIPTAMILTCPNIKTEKDILYKGIEYWDQMPVIEMSMQHQFDLKSLLSSYSATQFYIHPVKLSKWSL